MAKTGRPSLYRKEFHNQDFLEQSNMGNDIRQIARAWGIDRSSIYEWAKKHKEFSHTIKKGQELCEAWYIDLGKAAMVGKAREKNGNPIKVDLGWYVWMTKNICKWTDRVEQKNEITGKNGSPLGPQVILTMPANGTEAKK